MSTEITWLLIGWATAVPVAWLAFVTVQWLADRPRKLTLDHSAERLRRLDRGSYRVPDLNLTYDADAPSAMPDYGADR